MAGIQLNDSVLSLLNLNKPLRDWEINERAMHARSKQFFFFTRGSDLSDLRNTDSTLYTECFLTIISYRRIKLKHDESNYLETLVGSSTPVSILYRKL